MGLDKMGLDRMGLDEMGINHISDCDCPWQKHMVTSFNISKLEERRIRVTLPQGLRNKNGRHHALLPLAMLYMQV